MTDLKGYRDELYATEDRPDRLKSIELLLIRIVDALDLVMLKLDVDQTTHIREGQALQNIAKALNKLTKAHVEMTHIQREIQEKEYGANKRANPANEMGSS